MKTYVIEYSLLAGGIEWSMIREIHRAANKEDAIEQLIGSYNEPQHKVTQVEACRSLAEYREHEESLELETEHNPYDEYDC